MKTKTGYLFLLILAFMPVFSIAQINLGSPSTIANGGAVTAKVDEWMAIGVNPANLGWDENHTFSFSIFNFGLDFQAHSLDFPLVTKSLTGFGSFPTTQQQQWENVFSPPGLVFNSEVTWVSGSFFINKVGGFGIGISDRVFGDVTLSRPASNILFNGINLESYADSSYSRESVTRDLIGSNINFTHLRELNIDFGRKIFQYGSNFNKNKFEIFGGIGLNYLWGLANYQTQIVNNGIEGQSSAYNSNFGEMFSAPGQGLGIDLGLSAKYKLWKFGVSITDIGFVKWTNSSKIGLDTNVAQLIQENGGISSINTSTNIPIGEIIQNTPGPDYTTHLPTQLRLGADYRPIGMFEFSSDLVFPLNNQPGNILNPYMVVAGELHGPRGFDFNMGIEASATGVGIPMGVFLGPLKLYIGTGDILSIFGVSKNPNLSLVVGVFHFDF